MIFKVPSNPYHSMILKESSQGKRVTADMEGEHCDGDGRHSMISGAELGKVLSIKLPDENGPWHVYMSEQSWVFTQC